MRACIGEALLDAQPLGRAAGRDPVRQRSRTRDAGARLPLCRHPLCADLAGLFAGLDRFRQAALHLRPADAGPGLRLPTGKPFAQGDRGGRAGRCRACGHAQPVAGRPASICSTNLAATMPTEAIEAAHDKVGPDTIAKFLFTSGSTGMPKGVINTQRMWCSNQVMVRSALQCFQDEPPVIARLGALASHRRRQSRCRARAL